jgi:diamine N-acetyltransferase
MAKWMQIRPATEHDLPLLIFLAQEIWRECYPEIISEEQIEFMLGWMYAEDTIREEMRRGTTWEIADSEAGPIGFLSYEMEGDHRVKLHKLYLLPDYHGLGLGQQMLEHVLEQAREWRAVEVWMQVNKRNELALAAYRRAGFRQAGEGIFEIGNGYVMDDYLLAKAVG